MTKWITLVLGILLSASPAGAQDPIEWLSGRLGEITGASALQGYSLDGHALSPYALAGRMRPSDTVTFVVNLWAGRDYRITGVCDRGCADLDLRIHGTGEDGAPLAEDTLADNVPLLAFTPRTTGPHLLSVEMAQCAGESCYFSLRVLSK